MLVNVALTSLAVSAAVVATPVARGILGDYEVAPKYEPSYGEPQYGEPKYGEPSYEPESSYYGSDKGEYKAGLGEVVGGITGSLDIGTGDYESGSGYESSYKSYGEPSYEPKESTYGEPKSTYGEPAYKPKQYSYKPKKEEYSQEYKPDFGKYQEPCKTDECGEFPKDNGYTPIVIYGAEQKKRDYVPATKTSYAKGPVPKDCAEKRCKQVCDDSKYSKYGSSYESKSSYAPKSSYEQPKSDYEQPKSDYDSEETSEESGTVSRRMIEHVEEDLYKPVDCMAFTITEGLTSDTYTCSLYDSALDSTDSLVDYVGSAVDNLAYNVDV